MIASALLPAAIPSPPESLAKFSIGPLTIHAYALCILLGIIAAIWLTLRRWKARGGQSDVIWDVAIWAIPFGIIGGRLYHVISSPDAYFGPGFDGTGDPIKILYIWNGGLGIWGAIALGALGAWIGTRRAGVRLSAFADAAAPGVLLAQAIGRWGNWFNQELFGSATTLPWGLRIDPNSPNFPAGYPADTLFQPTFLYESLWSLAGVAVLLLVDRRFKLRFGALVWLYVVIYTAGRTWIEAMRIDEAQMITISGITARLNVWTSLIVFVLALLIFIFCLLRSRRMRDEDFMHLPGRAPAGEASEGDAEDSGRQAKDDEEPVAVAAEASSAEAGSTETVSTGASERPAPAAEPAPAAPAGGASEEESPYPTADDVAPEEADKPAEERKQD
jgi:prolipoprotein diacylglyceryl transferase